MSLLRLYQRLADSALLSQSRADEIVAAARPMAVAALGSPQGLRVDVVACQVEPAAARGGCLIPAWPFRSGDDAVTIEFVADWGVMLSVWRSLIGDSPEVDELLRTGQRQWIGIANDVLQLYVPDPPEGTYSMVRHHGLMLAAATVWLGPDATRRWLNAHALAASRFIRSDGDLWPSIQSAEAGLSGLLTDPRAHQATPDVVAWLDSDDDARSNYENYLAAASLGVAALLDSVPEWTADRLSELVLRRHPDPDFNRAEIERFVLAVHA